MLMPDLVPQYQTLTFHEADFDHQRGILYCSEASLSLETTYIILATLSLDEQYS